MTTNPQLESPAIAENDLGLKLRQAREQRKLSLEQVSAQINLRPELLQEIESNNLSESKLPVTYIKGYIRSYARFLGIPESEYLKVNQQFTQVPVNDLGKNSRNANKFSEISSPRHGRWIGYLTGLVIFVVLGMTALWWWENYQKSSEERDDLVQTYVVEENAQSASSSSVQSSVSLSDNSGGLSLAPLNNDTATPTEQPTSLSSDNVENIEIEPETNTSLSVENPVQAEPVVTEQKPVITSDLHIEITGANCWVSVKDANRKVLAQKEYKQGEILTFDGKGPYSLIIGAPANVKITYKGEVYPLKVDGRIAKFKLQ